MDAIGVEEWISRCTARLQRHWQTVEPPVLEETAIDLLRDPGLRREEPEAAAETWLRQGVLIEPPTDA